MELFDSDRLPQNNGVIFPDQLAPFPELIYHNQELPPPASSDFLDEAGVESHRCNNLPPQKLRPIRCTVRSPADSGGPISGAISGYQSTDVEVLDRMAEFVSGRGELRGKQTSIDSEGRVGEDESTESTCSPSDGGDASPLDIREPDKRKRKRRTLKKLQPLLENLVMKLMERQEQMHKQLMEMMEKRERERISREEAWQREEMERLKINEELRAQETSRSLALISVIQKMLGQDNPQTPEPLNIVRHEEIQGETHSNEEVNYNSGNKRWPEDEVQMLIFLRTALDHQFHASDNKGSVWQEVSVGMSSKGYKRSAKKCKEKWENMNKYFKKTAQREKMRPSNSKTCPYFQELDIFYKNSHIVHTGSVLPEDMNHGEHELASPKEVECCMNVASSIDNLRDTEGNS